MPVSEFLAAAQMLWEEDKNDKQNLVLFVTLDGFAAEGRRAAIGPAMPPPSNALGD